MKSLPKIGEFMDAVVSTLSPETFGSARYISINVRICGIRGTVAVFEPRIRSRKI